MSVFGRRGSTGEGWTWSRPPRTPWRPRGRVLGAVIGVGTAASLIVLGVFVILASDDGPAGGSTASPTPSPTAPPATATATTTAAPTATATAAETSTATPAPTPTPTPTPAPGATLVSGGSTFRLAVWDGERWRGEPPTSVAYGEGDAVPFLLRIENADAGSMYSLVLRRECRGFDAITSYDREAGAAPALDGEGPGSDTPDSAVPAPGADGGLGLWGGLFTGLGEPQPADGCDDERRLDVSLRALRGDVFVLWGAVLSDGAAEAGAPFQMTVEIAGAGEVTLPLEPAAVQPAQ